MKRTLIGVSAILAAAVLPFSGASAASSVDYEKSVGQIDGADTINWVVEATDDGGYVVGGQTVICYKTIAHSILPESVHGNSTTLMQAGEDEKVSMEKCVEYYREHSSAIENDDANNFSSTLSNSVLAASCQLGGYPVNVGIPVAGETYYYGKCLDFIAKFKTDGTKELLKTFDNSSRPIAVKKLSNNTYKLITNNGCAYLFGNDGTEISFTCRDSGDSSDKAYINDDGSYVLGGFDALLYSSGEDINNLTSHNVGSYLSEVFPTSSGYVVSASYPDSNNSNVWHSKIIDFSKDLSSQSDRELEGVDNGYAFLFSANKQGDIIVLIRDGEDNYKFAGYDKDGKKLGELSVGNYPTGHVVGYKDFTLGLTTVELSDAPVGVAIPITKVVKLNRDLSVQYEYSGTGNEFIADVAELKDQSLAGVGLAVKGSTAINVDGDVNGGYMRLTADTSKPEQSQQSTSQAKPTSRPGVKNPKTLDDIQIVATVGSAVLLGLGVILRKTLMRR